MNEEETLTIPELQPVHCKCCFKKTDANDQFCQRCGFPLKGSEEEQKIFIYRRGFKEIELKNLQKKIKSAGTTLYVLAAYFFLFGLGFFFINHDNTSSAVLIANGVAAIIFLLLGYWSMTKPVAAIVSGMLLFIIDQLIPVFDDPSRIFQGLLIKIIIIGYLIKGLQSAFEAEKIRKQHNI